MPIPILRKPHGAVTEHVRDGVYGRPRRNHPRSGPVADVVKSNPLDSSLIEEPAEHRDDRAAVKRMPASGHENEGIVAPASTQLKGVIKTALKSAGATALPSGMETAEGTRDSAAEATLKGMMEDAISQKYLNASIAGHHRSLTDLASSLPGKFEAADVVARNMAEAVGNLITLYNTGMGVAQLVQESAILRRNQAAILDDIANLEVDFGSATERMTGLAQDLERCRWVHSTTTAPLRPSPTS